MPPRLRDVARALKQWSIRVTPGAKHFRAVARDGTVYPLPAHNGEKTEIDDKYIRAMCRTFGIDEAELRSLL